MYKFNDGTNKWFSSYLLERSQCFQVESSFSHTFPVPWGVAQGSIVGPLLFLLFLNELPDIVKNVPNEDLLEADHTKDNEIVIYADDNTPISGDKDPMVLQEKVQEEADMVTDWFSRNDMICSSEKTKLLIIGTASARRSKLQNQNLQLKVDICGEEKSESESEKLLGIVVNSIATFKNHLYGDEENDGLMKQLSTRVAMLKKLKKFIPPVKLKTIMEGMS